MFAGKSIIESCNLIVIMLLARTVVPIGAKFISITFISISNVLRYLTISKVTIFTLTYVDEELHEAIKMGMPIHLYLVKIDC